MLGSYPCDGLIGTCVRPQITRARRNTVPRYSAPPPRLPPAPAHQPGRVLRAVALTAVSAGVLILAAAAFILSYSGIHAIARQAGVPATLARGYPVIFDAMLVVACAAVLSLRGAGAVSRCYAWLSLLVLLGATAGADALHATVTTVPHRAAALAAAVIPWILLLIGFGLLLAMLRHFRLHRPSPAAGAAVPAAPPETRRPAALPPGPSQPAPLPLPPPPSAPAAEAPAPDVPTAAPRTVPPVTVPPQPSRDHREPSGDGDASARIREPAPAAPSAPPKPAPAPEEPRPAPAEPDLAYLDRDEDPGADPGAGEPGSRAADVPEKIFAAPPAEDDRTGPGPADPADGPRKPQPAFHRMWSSPTPPGDEDED
jgi:hypothetical protein